MPAWALWAILAVLLAVGEMTTLSLVLGPVAVAALLASVVSLVAPVSVQLVVFIVASIASLAFLRPVAKRHLRTPVQIRTGTAALIGQRALVLERVDDTSGRVKIGGEEWSARAYAEGAVYEAGERVDVLKIDGATALVSE